MRKGSYITVAICAVFFNFASTPVWLCVSANGPLAIKTDAEAPCESACSDESDAPDENVLVAVPAPDDCCLDIPIGFDGKPQPVKLTRPRKDDLPPAPTQTPTLCTLSIPTAPEFGLLTQSHLPGSSHLLDLIRTVVLLI